MVRKFNSLIQLINWLVTGTGIIYSIFIRPELGSQWWIIAQTGIGVQLIGLLVNKMEGRVNRSWLIVASVVFAFHLLLWVDSIDLFGHNILGNSMQVLMMGILISNLLFAYTISFIIQEIRYAFSHEGENQMTRENPKP